MNKTLLLIICDFLLLNLIHFTAWDKISDPEEKVSHGGMEQIGAGMGDVSDDNELILKKYDLARREAEDKEAEMAALMATTESDAQQAAKDLAAAHKNANAWKNAHDEKSEEAKNLSAAINELDQQKILALAERDKERQTVKTITEERIKLQQVTQDLTNEVKSLQNTTNQLTGKIGDLNLRVNQLGEDASKAREAEKAALLAKAKAEGEMRRAQEGETAAKNLASNAAKVVDETKRAANVAIAEAKTEAEKQVKTAQEFAAKQINTANELVVKAEQKVTAAQAQTRTAQAETKVAVEAAQTARIQVAETTKKLELEQVKTETLTANVQQAVTQQKVAEQAVVDLTEKISKKIPDQPINANVMATLYGANHVDLRIQGIRTLSKPDVRSKSVLFQTAPTTRGGKPYVYAIVHVKDTPFRLTPQALGWKETYGSVSSAGSQPTGLHHVRFLKDDPRLVVIPLGDVDSTTVKALGVKPYKLAEKPFKFPKAFIMKRDGRKFGEAVFQIDPQTSGYVKMDKSFIRSIFGEFNPAQGDLVFSQTGELLGVMANSKYCRVITNVVPADAVVFGKNDSNAVARKLANLAKAINAKPLELR